MEWDGMGWNDLKSAFQRSSTAICRIQLNVAILELMVQY